jgi:uncharacterized protein (DUF58 family)
VTPAHQVPPSLATDGLTNARTRIVGNRTGASAELVIAVVRAGQQFGAVVVRWFRTVASIITPLGWLTTVLVVPSLVLGYRWSWTTLVLLGFVGLAIMIIAAGYLITVTTLEVTLVIPQPRVVAGDYARGIVTVKNSRRRRSGATIVEVPIAQGFTELTVPSLTGSAEHSAEFSIPALRRGRVLVGPARTVRADPVGLVRKVVSWGEAVELFVHPKTTGIPSVSSGVLRDLEGTPTRDITDSDVSFHALREYRAGDDRRYIHWKSTAKTGVHMVRQFEETRRSHIMIAMTLAQSDYATEEEFELAVSATGSLGARAIRDVREVSVVVSEKTPEFARRKTLALRQLSTVTRDRLLDDLTIVEPHSTALSILDLARVAGPEAFGVSIAFLICGSSVSAATLRAATAKFPLGITVIAVVCAPDVAPGLRHVAGDWVLTIGFLEDLRTALSRIAAQ